MPAAATMLAAGCNNADRADGSVPGYAESAFADFPRTTVQYFDVYGSDEPSIRKSLDALGPKDPNDGIVADALTSWHAKWHWNNDANGRCDLQDLQYSFTVTVTLPRLADEERLTPQVKKDWGNFMAAMIEHELGHVKHAVEHKQDIADAVRSSNCENANAAGYAKIAELKTFDAQYDQETKHGATQGVKFPT